MNARHTSAVGLWAAGRAGYLLDLWRFATGAPANLHSLMKYRVIRALAKRIGADCLIETGTFQGVMAARCARVFATVLTVELDAKLAAQAKAFLAKYRNDGLSGRRRGVAAESARASGRRPVRDFPRRPLFRRRNGPRRGPRTGHRRARYSGAAPRPDRRHRHRRFP